MHIALRAAEDSLKTRVLLTVDGADGENLKECKEGGGGREVKAMLQQGDGRRIQLKRGREKGGRR